MTYVGERMVCLVDREVWGKLYRLTTKPQNELPLRYFSKILSTLYDHLKPFMKKQPFSENASLPQVFFDHILRTCSTKRLSILFKVLPVRSTSHYVGTIQFHECLFNRYTKRKMQMTSTLGYSVRL